MSPPTHAQTSLAQFNGLYEQAIDRAERAVVPARRVANIVDTLTHQIYLYIQRGLFERHKLPFALMLSLAVLASSGQIRGEALDAFLKMGGALDVASVRKKPKEWVPNPVWLNAVALSALDAFKDLPDSVARSDAAWRAWYDHETPEAVAVPELEGRLSDFERMCIVRWGKGARFPVKG